MYRACKPLQVGVVIARKTEARKGPGYQFTPAFNAAVQEGMEFQLIHEKRIGASCTYMMHLHAGCIALKFKPLNSNEPFHQANFEQPRNNSQTLYRKQDPTTPKTVITIPARIIAIIYPCYHRGFEFAS